MKLRIIAGLLKRRNIVITGAVSEFRPTKEIVREAVAGYLQNRIAHARVADICAGSGAFGFEMLSRGAQSVHFVESNGQRCRMIKKNAALFNVDDTCRIFKQDVRGFLKRCAYSYDIIYYDPPYKDELLAEILPNILSYMAAKGILVFERQRDGGKKPALSDEFCVKTRTYGDTELVFVTHLE